MEKNEIAIDSVEIIPFSSREEKTAKETNLFYFKKY